MPEYERGAGRARRRTEHETEMKRSETGLRHEPGTAAAGRLGPDQALAGPGRGWSWAATAWSSGWAPAGSAWSGRRWDEKLERDVAVKAMPRERGGGERASSARRGRRPAEPPRHRGASTSWPPTSTTSTWCPSWFGAEPSAELRARGRCPTATWPASASALCDALEHAHARGVIHRDVKPQNVMVLAEPAAGAGFAKLTDFGVAHVASGDPLTRTGDVVGTLAYMAPEQAEGARVTAASDVYSLALTLYEAWTGTNPVRGREPGRHGPPAGPAAPAAARGSRRDLPPELCDAIDDALDPDPGDAPGAGRAARGAGATPSPSSTTRAAWWSRRRSSASACRAGRPVARPRARRGPACSRPASARPRPPPDGRAERVLGRAGGARADRAPGRARRRRPGRPGRWCSPALGAGPGAAVLPARCRRRWPPVATALLPRIGWLLSALGLCLWLASPEADRQGTALVLAAAARARAAAPPARGLALVAARLWRRCWARSRWRRRSWASRRSPPPPGAGPAWPRRASVAGCSARRSPARRCCSACPTARCRAATGRARSRPRRRDALEPLAATPALAPAAGVGRLRRGAAAAWCAAAGWRSTWLGAGLWAVAPDGRTGGARRPAGRRGGPRPGPRARGGRRWLAALVAVSVTQIVAPAERLAGAPDDHGLAPRTTLRTDMSMLRNLEAKLGGLVEGAFGRAFKSSVQPVELAHKLAKEMEEQPDGLRLARLRAQPLPRVPLAAGPRAVRELRAGAAQGAVGLPARARPPGALALTSRPQIEFHTDDRLELGEFGIQAQLLAPPEERGGRARRGARALGRATSGTRWSTRPTARRACSSPSRPRARRCSCRRRAAQRAERRPRGGRPQPRVRRRASPTPTCHAATPSCAATRTAGTRATSARPTA